MKLRYIPLIALTALCGSAFASVKVVDTFPGIGAPTIPAIGTPKSTIFGNTDGRYAAGFTWTVDEDFDHAVLSLSTGVSGSVNLTSIGIYNSSGSQPGSLVLNGALSAGSSSISGTGYADYTFTAGSPVTLTNGDIYWLVADADPNDEISWDDSDGSTTMNAINTTSVFISGSGWLNVPSDGSTRNAPARAFAVYAKDPATTGGGGSNTGTVPEPTTLALLGLGLAGIGAARRRKTA